MLGKGNMDGFTVWHGMIAASKKLLCVSQTADEIRAMLR
jgi:hypothetical protein